LNLSNPGVTSIYRGFANPDAAMDLPKDAGVDTSSVMIGVPAETHEGENRVSVSPNAVTLLKKQGFNVCVERGAGINANFLDSDYESQGATMVDRSDALGSDIVLKVREPTVTDINSMKEGSTLYSFLYPKQNQELVEAATQRGVNTFAMESVPRISRAQVFDALSSMANISGYKAVIESAHHFGRLFTGQMTAAGKMPPAKV